MWIMNRRPAQYLVRDAPEVARLLLSRGAWFDIFLAIGLRDTALVERCLRDDPEALDHRIGQGKYQWRTTARSRPHARRSAIAAAMCTAGCSTANISAIDAAARFGNDEILALLLDHATPAQRLLAACAKADRATAEAIVAAHPDLVASLRPEEMRMIADKAQDSDTAAVALMLDLGFDQRVAGPDHGDALHWAAFHGNTEMVRMLCDTIRRSASATAATEATPLGWCLFGAVEGWAKNRGGDYPTTVRLLLDAGETFEPVDPADGPRRCGRSVAGASERAAGCAGLTAVAREPTH